MIENIADYATVTAIGATTKGRTVCSVLIMDVPAAVGCPLRNPPCVRSKPRERAQ